MNAICVVIDGLHLGMLGCYGNDWTATPAIDRLACEGFVFDQALIDGPALSDFYRAVWQGRHGLAPPVGQPPARTLPRQLREAGIATALWTDEPRLARLPGWEDFDAAEQLDFELPSAPADEWELTASAQLFAAAAEGIATLRPPFLLWLHCRGPAGIWDAPLEMRQAFAEEADVAPYAGSAPQRVVLGEDHDPDVALSVRWSYAAEAAVVDRCLEAFAAAIAAAGLAGTTLLSVQGCRGFHLGEHRLIGPPDASPRLHEELIHVPWLLRLPNELGPGRSQALVQPVDLAATLLDAFGLPANGASVLSVVRGERETIRDRACLASPGERGLRTAAWYLRWRDAGDSGASSTPASDATSHLYSKPDDRWEVNDVANRLPDLVDPLRRAFDDYGRHLAEPSAPLPPLEEVLLAEPA